MIIAPRRLHLRGAPDAKPPPERGPTAFLALLAYSPIPRLWLGDGGWDELILSDMLSAMAEIEGA